MKWLSLILLAATTARAETNTPPSAPKTEPTVVRSEKLNVDYIHNVGTFEGDVLVVDPKITVRADKMVVTFASGTNDTQRSLQKIVATGAVTITIDDRKATSEQAEYTAGDGKVVLTGNPAVETHDGTVRGERITFWRDEQRMDVESGTQLILYPEEQKKQKEPPVETVPPTPPDNKQ